MAEIDLTQGRGAAQYSSSTGSGLAAGEVDAIIGQTLGSFRILSLLGEGGMGRVYLAEHVLIGRRAAIKLLAAEIAGNEDVVSRFFTEARAVNDIRHPNIVEVTDFGSFGSQPYLVMELLDGETLEQRLARVGCLDLEAAARMVVQVASAVGSGHRHGLVHRDLKPANIFLRAHPDYPDFVKVLDFGIAKLVTRDSSVRHHTEVGALIGTPAYMSPEQCLGDSQLDHRSDIYSLGVVLYQTVTGRLPFSAANPGRLIVCHVHEQPPAPQAVNGNVSPGLSAVILKAMAKKPEQRFASMLELREAVLLAAPTASPLPSLTPPPLSFPPGHTTLPAFSSCAQATVPTSVTPVVEHATTPTGDGPSLASRLIEIVRSRTATDVDLDLPTLPRSILRGLDLLGAPDFSFRAMASLLATDARLAAQLTHIADATGPCHAPARSLEQAIARLGAEGVRTGLLESALRPLLENAAPRLQVVCRQPWPHALAVALIGKRLVHLRGNADEHMLLDGYRSGLFHDAGKPMTANLLFAIERQMANGKGRKLIGEGALTACVDHCHAVLGARLARSWGLSPRAAAAIAMVGAAAPGGEYLAGVLRLAHALACQAGFHTRRDELDRSRLLVDDARRDLGLSEEYCHRALEGIKDAVAHRL
ncbi:MAG: protein kinase [Polyangia bacterium]